jgi:hypothetical protein
MKRIHPEQNKGIDQIAAKEKEKRFIESVEFFLSDIGPDQSSDLLLVYSGKRRATAISLRRFEITYEVGGLELESEERQAELYRQLVKQALDGEEAEKIEKVVQRIELSGMSVCLADPDITIQDGRCFYRPQVIIAKDKETMIQLRDAWNRQEKSRDNEILIGLLLGYPRTAVEAFASVSGKTFEEQERVLMDSKEILDEYYDDNTMAFGRIRYSRTHWKEELQQVREWKNEIKRMSPKIYKAVVDDFHDEREV